MRVRVHMILRVCTCICEVKGTATTERVNVCKCVPASALSEIIRPTGKATDLSIVIMSLTMRLGSELYYRFDDRNIIKFAT